MSAVHERVLERIAASNRWSEDTGAGPKGANTTNPDTTNTIVAEGNVPRIERSSCSRCVMAVSLSPATTEVVAALESRMSVHGLPRSSRWKWGSDRIGSHSGSTRSRPIERGEGIESRYFARCTAASGAPRKA